MKFSVLCLVSAAAAALAQTPPKSYPSTKSKLGASFENVTITPGIWIGPSGSVMSSLARYRIF
jgi:hypothetical protein